MSLHRVQGWADPFHTECARSARANTRICKLTVAPFLHCSVTPRRPCAALRAQVRVLRSVAASRRRHCPLQHCYSGHTPPTAAFTPDAHCIHCSPHAQTLCETTMSAPRSSKTSGSAPAFAAPRAAERWKHWRRTCFVHRIALLQAAATGSIAAAATRRHHPRELLWWG